MNLSANAAQLRGQALGSPALAVEIMAQAARLLLANGGREDLLLAGIDDAHFHAPLSPGDRCSARAVVVGRWGNLVKVKAGLDRGSEIVAEAGLLLASLSR